MTIVKKVYILKQPIIFGYHVRICYDLTEVSEKLNSLDATVLIVDNADEIPRHDDEALVEYIEEREGVPVRELLKMQ